MARILVVEDRATLRHLYVTFLQDLGHQVAEAESAEEALRRLGNEKIDLVLCDYLLPGMNGLELVQQARTQGLESVFVMMTAFGEVKLAVDCIKSGAFDFLEKPVDLDYLEVVIGKALEHQLLKDSALLNATRGGLQPREIIGSSPLLRKAVDVLDRVAESTATCLIQGESGTGKELFAERLHAHSSRNSGQFVTINCASIPSELLESELFGHEKGAFTGAVKRKKGLFELAQGGTIFMDEIGELPLELQPKLLRVMQDKTFRTVGGTQLHHADIRFVCATNRDLQYEVQRGRFREDLFFRISVFPIQVPSLRSHIEDLEDLITHFLERKGCPEAFPDQDTLQLLQSYPWPGNVRELENVIERATILSQGKPIGLDHIPNNLISGSMMVPIQLNCETDLKTNLETAQQHVEKAYLQFLYNQYRGNKTKIAKHVGMSVKTLVKRLEQFGIAESAKK